MPLGTQSRPLSLSASVTIDITQLVSLVSEGNESQYRPLTRLRCGPDMSGAQIGGCGRR